MYPRARAGRQPDTTPGESARPIKQFDPPFTARSTPCVKYAIVWPLLFQDKTQTGPDSVTMYLVIGHEIYRWCSAVKRDFMLKGYIMPTIGVGVSQ